ncbi:F510_1955 family glycosylhydrolase [Halalkalibacter nanhaiisediminis]|nr:hypothetical protein [Halalkalibacter nanhaiisediminis]
MKHIIFTALVVIILAACSQTDEIESYTHIHGLEYANESFYIATHHGLIQVDESGWQQVGEPEQQHDLMGFTVLNDGTMISSGHPSIRSDLANPLGVVISDDQGLTWEPIALYEEVDFHSLHVNEGDQNIMYGVDAGNSVLYKSENKGHDWSQVNVEGLSVAEIITLVSNPLNPDYVLAGLETGLFVSENGGESWSQAESDYTATAFVSMDEESEVLIAYLIGSYNGLYVSEDFGQTWTSLHLELEEDVVTMISKHPVLEGTILVGTMQQSIYETANMGEDWTMLAEEGVPVSN